MSPDAQRGAEEAWGRTLRECLRELDVLIAVFETLSRTDPLAERIERMYDWREDAVSDGERARWHQEFAACLAAAKRRVC